VDTTTLAAASAAPATGGQTISDHYSVIADEGKDQADALSRQLEAYFGLFDSIFHFPADQTAAKLNVREFKDKAGFDDYLKQIVGDTRDDFVYLQYSTPQRSELLLFPKPDPDFSESLAHQAFVQYIRAYIPNPPLWLREGFAVWFESARWDDKAGKLKFPENLAWLATAKSLKNKNLLMPLDKLLTIGQDEARSELDVFYPQAWALVSFLVNSSDKGYNRLLWDSIAAMRKDASLEENQAAVASIVKTWYGVDNADKALAAYLDGRKTFAELVEDGVKAYANQSWDDAAKAFGAAADIDKDSYIPQYYLGLIAYAKNDFSSAELRYKAALQLGCDPAITNYALGIDAYAQNRLDDARSYLNVAKQAAPDRYGTKVDTLLARFPQK
jgi:tetratricopeptide (TPR) repeat protein